MKNTEPHNAVMNAVIIEHRAEHLTIAEYLERYDPMMAEGIPYSELPEWLAARRSRLDEVELAFGISPAHRPDGTRVYPLQSLGWAIDVVWAVAGCAGAVPAVTETKWFTTHTAAPIAPTTAEQRELAKDPAYRWASLDPEYGMG